MNKKLTAVILSVSQILAGCAKNDIVDQQPLLGLNWFIEYDNARSELKNYSLIKERTSNDNDITQKMQDYADVMLFDRDCDLTLCFTDMGLVGFNYHDIARGMNYREWFNELETRYGVPTENGSNMASWYEEPMGKNTAVYLFNLEEGVQISFYVTADSPDKDYEKQRKTVIPTPEIRTPIVPVEEASTYISAADTTELQTTYSIPSDKEYDREYENEEDTAESAAEATELVTVSPPTATASTSITNVTTETEPVEEVDRTADYRYAEIDFYESISSVDKKLSSLQMISEYNNDDGQSEEFIQEYSNAEYLGKKCDLVLCFTDIGLVGINYFVSDSSDYNYWLSELTRKYGKPDSKQYDYAYWNNDPVGKGTSIYVFATEEDIQISFFADDTFS